jgi:hypothetical protein
MKLPATLMVGLAAAAAVAATATAGPSASASFCSDGSAFAKGTNILTTPPSVLKAHYTAFKAAEPAMLSSAPKSIKTDLTEVLNFDNGLFTELSKVGWSIANVPHSVLASWAVQGPKLKPASDVVIGYLDSNCGLKIPKP